MRWVLRLILLVIFLAGAVLAFAYPWAADNISAREIGTWRVYERATGFIEASANIAPSEAPVRMTLEVRTDGPIVNPDGAIVLTMTTTVAGRTVSAETFTLQDIEPRILSPQAPERLYRFEPLVIRDVEGSPYTFVVGPGEDDFPILAIDLMAGASAIDVDPRLPILGYMMMAIAGVFLLLTFRRRRVNPNEKPPQPRWGRQ